MTKKDQDKIRARCVVHYKRRVRALCKTIGIDPFGHRDILRLMNRLMLVAGAGIADRDLRVIVRLYNRELIGRKTVDNEKELMT